MPLCCIKLDTATDPACGSGNFLTETYLSLRKLENEVLRSLSDQITMDVDGVIQVSIGQFYGIEINDFAVTVAKTALWIAESQMMKATEDVVHMALDFLPLKSYANITEGNALRLDWESVVPKTELNYIMGNPPFVGARLMDAAQKDDLNLVFGGLKGFGNLDYVSGWYRKSVNLMQNTYIRAALVSTNSITQGEQVPLLWKGLINDGVHIDFAYRTFRWDSEAKMKAHVHCVIVGFSVAHSDKSKLRKQPKGAKRRPVGGSAVKELKKQEEQNETMFFTMLHCLNLFACLEVFFADARDFRVEPPTINRNYIDHGMNQRVVRKRDCIQLFLALNNLLFFYESKV